jgi:hypothetical protein
LDSDGKQFSKTRRVNKQPVIPAKGEHILTGKFQVVYPGSIGNNVIKLSLGTGARE